MWQDIAYALRTFTKNPVFTLVAVITIALGVGPNSVIFSIINAVLLRPLPYRDAARIVMLWETNKQKGLGMLPVSGPDFNDWKRDSRSFEDMAPGFTISEYGFNVTAGGEPERVQAGQAAANLFSVLGIQPVAGRFFLPEEDRPGGRPVAVISQSFWTRRFGSSRDIIGRPIGLDGESRIVVGVLPREFESLGKVDVWIPIARDLALQPRTNHNYGILARLRPGVTAVQARAEMDGIARRLEQQYPATNAGIGAMVVPINELLTGLLRPALMVLLAAVGLLLLIACTNVANLLLSRGAARRKEIAIRAAIGAGRSRITRQLLTESVLLAAAGGLLGILLATWTLHLMVAQLPDIIPRLKQIDIDARVLFFSLGVAVLTGILFGLMPALRLSKADLNDALKEGGGKGTSADNNQRARTILLSGEVMLAVILLTGAGLLVRSFVNVTSVNPGFRPGNVLTMQLALPESKYRGSKEVRAFVREAMRRVAAISGVRSAAAVQVLPTRASFLTLRIAVVAFHIEGEAPAINGQEPLADFRSITPGFLASMGIPLRRGRSFTDDDADGKQSVVLINETMANRFFRNVDPVGRRLRFDPLSGGSRLIVGVVGDVRMQGLDSPVEPAVYVPFEQRPSRSFSFVIRSGSDPARLTDSIRREVLAMDPDQPISDIRTMEGLLSDSLLVRRLSVWMLGVFAVLALALASIGIYGLTSYSVSRMTHEIGLRIALGAQPAGILRFVVWRAILAAAVGVVLALPLAFATGRLMRALLFGVTTTDIPTFLVVPVLLICVAAVSCYLPARRALRIDPIIALRYE